MLLFDRRFENMNFALSRLPGLHMAPIHSSNMSDELPMRVQQCGLRREPRFCWTTDISSSINFISWGEILLAIVKLMILLIGQRLVSDFHSLSQSSFLTMLFLTFVVLAGGYFSILRLRDGVRTQNQTVFRSYIRWKYLEILLCFFVTLFSLKMIIMHPHPINAKMVNVKLFLLLFAASVVINVSIWFIWYVRRAANHVKLNNQLQTFVVSQNARRRRSSSGRQPATNSTLVHEEIGRNENPPPTYEELVEKELPPTYDSCCCDADAPTTTADVSAVVAADEDSEVAEPDLHDTMVTQETTSVEGAHPCIGEAGDTTLRSADIESQI